MALEMVEPGVFSGFHLLLVNWILPVRGEGVSQSSVSLKWMIDRSISHSPQG